MLRNLRPQTSSAWNMSNSFLFHFNASLVSISNISAEGGKIAEDLELDLLPGNFMAPIWRFSPSSSPSFVAHEMKHKSHMIAEALNTFFGGGSRKRSWIQQQHQQLDLYYLNLWQTFLLRHSSSLSRNLKRVKFFRRRKLFIVMFDHQLHGCTIRCNLNSASILKIVENMAAEAEKW